MQPGGKKPNALGLLATILAAAVWAAPVHAQSGEQKDSVGEDAVDAITQPLTDLNLRSKDIPLILVIAQSAPYDLSQVPTCDALRNEVSRLEEVLGPDADAPPEKDGLVNKVLKTGGDTLGGLIPFRGLVRQLSGAKAEQKKWQAAIYAGVARRSFLKGYLTGRGCQSSEEQATSSAREILGLEED